MKPLSEEEPVTAKAHIPTRMCPHPWCRPVHGVTAAMVVLALLPSLGNIWLWIALPALGVLVYALVRLLVDRNADRDQEHREEIAARDGIQLARRAIRPAWARAAVTLDILLLFGSAAVLALTLSTDPSLPAEGLQATLSDLPLLLPPLALILVIEYCHKKATVVEQPVVGKG